jgi:very-short-patch-repair endonuclease
LDFYCPSEKLAIELDGQGHLQPSVVAYDAYRTQYLETLGIHVIRFWNREIFSHPELVLDQIKANFQQKTQ